jgi:alkyl hydroperoxide reductase subunit AhpC
MEEKDAQVLGISCDSRHAQRMCANSLGNIAYPLLADFHPHGKVSQAFGVYNAEQGTPIRSAFLIDKEGIIRYSHVSAQGTVPDPEQILAELEKIAARPA